MLAGEIEVQGNAANIGDGSISPSAGNHTHFGSVNVPSGDFTRTFTIRNVSTTGETLTINSPITIENAVFIVTLPGAADFTVTAQPVVTSLAPGDSTTFSVKFDPSAGLDRTAQVRFTNSDTTGGEGTYTFWIRGAGVDVADISVTNVPPFLVPAIEIPDGDATPNLADGTDFGGAPLSGATVVSNFRVVNTGGVALNISSVTITGDHAADFTLTTSPTTPVPAATGVFSPGISPFSITFDPSAMGQRNALVTITNDDPDAAEQEYTFAISGIGGVPDIDVQVDETSVPDGDNTSLPGDVTDFGAADLTNQSFVKTFTIRNTGDNILNLTGTPVVKIKPVQIIPGVAATELPGANDFTVSIVPELSTLDPEGFTTFQVTYDPQPIAVGALPLNTNPLDPTIPGPTNNDAIATDLLRFAKISIESNDANENPYEFVISGTALVGTVQATRSGNTVTVTDINPIGRNNGFVFSVVDQDLVISDLLSLETFTTASAGNTGGVLSAINKVLTIPLQGITTLVINGNGGNDTFTVGLQQGLSNVTLNGGLGDDTFGTVLGEVVVPVIPWLTTKLTINGGGVAGNLGNDSIAVDLSTIPALTAIRLGTGTNGVTSLNALLYAGFSYSGVENASLYDDANGLDLQFTKTSFAQGDFYARGGNIIPDRFELRKNTSPVNTATFLNSYVPQGTFFVPGKVIFYGRGGNDTLISTYSGHAAELRGEDGNDTLNSSDGADLVVGGIGNDTINAGAGNNLVWGDKDPIQAGLPDTDANREILANDSGGTGSPHHPTGTFADRITTLSGNDTIYAGPGGDTSVLAGTGHDYVHGGGGNDTLDGQAGNDRVYGADGNDTLFGRDGFDFLSGGAGNDRLQGGNQNDVLVGGVGTDTVLGEAGNDRAYQGSLSVTVNVATLPLVPPAAVPYTGTDLSLRKDDIHDQAMAELLADWIDGALVAGNLTLVFDIASVLG
jgi:hypothetical protein